MPSYVHSVASDFHHDIYSGFVYEPVQFRMNVDRMNVTELSTCTTCVDHARQHENSKLDFDIGACERFIHAMCTPQPDEVTRMIVCDDNFQKVPRMNSSLHHELFSGSVLKCLTMFAV